MNRSAKQFIYGALYLALIALVVGELLGGDRNGTTIMPSIPEGIHPLEMRGAVTIMTAADGSVTFLGRIHNPNPGHVASFSYSFRFIQNGATIFEAPRRTGFAHAGETTVLVETVFIPVPYGATTALAASKPIWEPAAFLIRPSVAVEGVEGRVDDRGPFVEGAARNRGAVAASDIRVVAILKDVNGFSLAAAQTAIGSAPGSAARPFFIRFPRDPDIARRAAFEKTEIILEAR
ncbi:MAG: hypothetical protein HYU81_02525 [Candidatus Brennerbacteria bacterium]|nr:hypothetical protein [Candidatus Brennerbacteria bacterium]